MLAKANDLGFLPTDEGATPAQIAKNALSQAIDRGVDYLVFDTAGRLTIDDDMMGEAQAIKGALKPHQVLLVLDGMTGQDAVKTGEAFHQALGVDGLVLTKMDGDSRGGAALSLRAATGKPILFLSTGEKVDALEPFHPDRLASRILGMGDVLTLVEKAQDKIDLEKAMELENKLRKSDLTLDDFLSQLREMRKLGSLGDILGLLPGGHKVDSKMTEEGEKELKRVEAIILSMTPKERAKPGLLDGSRKKRVAAGSGTQVQNVNKLLRDFEQVRTLAKRMKGPSKKIPIRGMRVRVASVSGPIPGFLRWPCHCLRRMGAEDRSSASCRRAKSPRTVLLTSSAYNAQPKEAELRVDAERAKYWLSVGATPSDQVKSLFKKAGIAMPVRATKPKKTKDVAPKAAKAKVKAKGPTKRTQSKAARAAAKAAAPKKKPSAKKAAAKKATKK